MQTHFYVLCLVALINAINAQCTSPAQALTLTRVYTTYAQQEQVHIYLGSSYTSTSTPLYSYIGTAADSSSTKTETICLIFGQPYTINLKETYGDGWSTGSYVSISLGDSELWRHTGPGYGVTSFDEHFIPSIFIAPGVAMKYTSAAQAGNQWTTATFADGAWNSGSADSFPVVSATTRYFRYSTAATITGYFALTLGFRTNSGFIAYVNGQEALRVGLPATGVTSATVSTLSETTTTWKTVTIPTSLFLTSGTSVLIAIEVHASATQMNQNEVFNLRAFLYNGDDYIVTNPYFGESVCNIEGNPQYGEGCDRMFDGNAYTKYLAYPEAGKNWEIVYTLPNYSAAWFNGYQMITGNDVPTRDPKTWSFYGSLDNGATWILLDEQTRTEVFPSRNAVYTFPLRSNDKIFSKVKWVITAIHGTERIQLSQLRLVANKDPIIVGLQYPSATFTSSVFVEFTITPLSSAHAQYTVTPAFPSTVYLNSNTGVITGAFETGISQVYTISGINKFTQLSESFQLTVTVASCDQPTKASIVIRKTNKGTSNEEKWFIYDSANNVVNSGEGTVNGADNVVSQCFNADNWKVKLYDDGNNGWAEGAFLDISIKYSSTVTMRIAHLHLISGTTAEYRVNTKFEYAFKSGWKYMAGSVPAGWNTVTYSDASWQPLTYTPAAQTTQKIVLLRKTFTVSSTANMKAWVLYFRSEAGVVIYINNNEVYRDYLPAGDITPATGATGGGDSFTWKSVSGPLSSISTSVTVAVALLSLKQTSYNIDFDGIFNLRSGNNVPLEVSGSSYTTNNVDMDGSAANAFDGLMNTRWITGLHNSVTPYYVQILFANRKTEFINKYCVVSGWDAPRHDVVDWTLQGIKSDNTYANLTSEVNVSWEERKQRQCFYIENTVAYRGIKFIAQRASVVQSSNRYVIMELEFYQEDLTTIVIPPLAFTTTEYKTYRGIAAAALSCTSEYYRNFKITPSLPEPLTMDSSNGYINGVPSTVLPRTQYTVTATSIKGQSSTTTIYITIEACGGANALVSLSLKFGSGSASEASWTLTNSAAAVIGSGSSAITWATISFGFCVPSGPYTFTFVDSANDGWGDASYTVTLEDGSVLTTGNVGSGESPKVVPLNVGRIVNSSGNTWKFLDGVAPANGWTGLAFNDASWSTATSEFLPVATGTTQYYRLQFNLNTMPANIAGLEVGVKTYAGAIIYLNGNEIRRVNMPEGSVTKDTLATVEYSTYILISTVLSNEKLIMTTGNNVLAVEIHKMNTIPSKNTFDALVGAISNNEYRVLNGVASSDIEKTGTEGIDKLFDNNIQTKTLTGPRCVGAEFRWKYNNERREVINHYSVTNANDCNQRHPSAWIILGSNNDEDWQVLHFAEKQYFTAFRQTVSFDFYNPTAYNSYKMYVTECANVPLDTLNCGAGNIQLSEFGLYTANVPLSCSPLDGFSGAPENGYGYKNCKTGYTGYQRKQCTSGVFNPVPQEFCNLLAPMLIRYSAKSYVFITGKANAIPAPRVIAAEHMFNITGVLGAGLTFDRKTGIISGTPSIDLPETTYTITVYNAKGSQSTEITISAKTQTGGMTGGIIALIVIAVIIIIAFIGVVVFCILNRTKKSSKNHKKLDSKKPAAKNEKKPTSSNKAVKV